MIGLIVGAVVLLLAAAVGTWAVLAGGTDYKVGECVKRDGERAVSAECTDRDAFRIVKRVEDHTQCPDPNADYVEVRSREILCLEKAGG